MVDITAELEDYNRTMVLAVRSQQLGVGWSMALPEEVIRQLIPHPDHLRNALFQALRSTIGVFLDALERVPGLMPEEAHRLMGDFEPVVRRAIDSVVIRGLRPTPEEMQSTPERWEMGRTARWSTAAEAVINSQQIIVADQQSGLHRQEQRRSARDWMIQRCDRGREIQRYDRGRDEDALISRNRGEAAVQARLLLRRYLTEEQREELDRSGQITVPTRIGNFIVDARYKSNNITTPEGRIACGGPFGLRSALPDADFHLTQKLAIEADPEGFMQQATKLGFALIHNIAVAGGGAGGSGGGGGGGHNASEVSFGGNGRSPGHNIIRYEFP